MNIVMGSGDGASRIEMNIRCMSACVCVFSSSGPG